MGAVKFCTDSPGPSRRVRKAATHERWVAELATARHNDLNTDNYGKHALTRAQDVGIRVKIADRVANLRACYRDGDDRLEMYQREAHDFEQVLRFIDHASHLWGLYDRLLGRW